MKKVSLLLALLLSGIILFAQENKQTASGDEVKTLFGKNDKISHGWFVGPQTAYTQFDGRDVWMGGIAAGWIINHNFTIGLTGMGFVNRNGLWYDNVQDTLGAYLEGGYGGLLLEYTLFPKSPVHVTFPVLIGGGGISMVSDDVFYTWDEDEWDDDHKVLTDDAFFVVEPGVRVELNVVKFFRINAGVSYRYVPDLNLKNMDQNMLNNFTATVGLKFGKF